MASVALQAQFSQQLEKHAAATQSYLDKWLSAAAKDKEAGRPTRLIKAMRHGVLNGGKRFRPFLVFECAALFGEAEEQAVTACAAAVEAVHCYSLIHDDLPSMDDDDLRRGQPTVHVAYDEATAILAGDALLTEAFALITQAAGSIALERIVAIVQALARDAGTGGMVGGQMFDLANEHQNVDVDTIIMTQALKTGALIRTSCEIGGRVGGANSDDLQRLMHYGELIGLTFQIADDLLDLTSDAKTLGKAAGKDAAAGKQTLVSMKGEQWARDKLQALVIEAETVLDPYGERAAMLKRAARFVAERSS